MIRRLFILLLIVGCVFAREYIAIIDFEGIGVTEDDDCLEYDNEVDCINEGCNWNSESCYEENIGNGEDIGYTCIYDADEGSDDCEEVYTAGLEEGILLGAQSGDVNGDGVLNVIDIVIFVDMIMNP